MTERPDEVPHTDDPGPGDADGAAPAVPEATTGTEPSIEPERVAGEDLGNESPEQAEETAAADDTVDEPPGSAAADRASVDEAARDDAVGDDAAGDDAAGDDAVGDDAVGDDAAGDDAAGDDVTSEDAPSADASRDDLPAEDRAAEEQASEPELPEPGPGADEASSDGAADEHETTAHGTEPDTEQETEPETEQETTHDAAAPEEEPVVEVEDDLGEPPSEEQVPADLEEVFTEDAEPAVQMPTDADAADEVDETPSDETPSDETPSDETPSDEVEETPSEDELAWVADRAAFADRQRAWATEDAEDSADADTDDADTTPDLESTVVLPPPEEPGAEPTAVPLPEPLPEPIPAPVPERDVATTAVLPSLPPSPPVAPAARTEPVVPAVRPETQPRHPRRRRRRLVALAAGAVVLVLLAGAYVGALWLWSDRVPPGTTVAGVDIGGLSADAAVSTLDESLRAATTEDLEVAAGDLRTALSPDAAGLAFDASATVESTTGFGLEPSRLWAQLFGAGAVEPVSDVDRDALEHALGDVVESLSVPPVDGGIQFVDGAPQPSPATEGVTLDVPAAVELLAGSWLTQARPIELPTKVDPAAVDDADVQEALAALAEPLRSAPVRVEAAGQVAELPTDVLTSAASFVPEDGELALVMNGPLLVEAVVSRTTNLLTAAEEPTFAFDANGPVIVPGAPGTAIDPDALALAVAEAATDDGDRTAGVELVESDPAESVAEMEALGVTQVVSEFSTPLTSEPRRTQNIANGASKINGMLIRPGEEFNLAEALGPLDAAHGYVQAGAIVSGEHTDAWGGGLSQMSTTTYNAAFFAGFELLEHQPHSEWFRRYPEGREATIFTPQINMRWRNNTPYGALLQSWVADGRVYVRVWSTPHFTVETTTSGRSNVVQPTTVYSQSPTCEAQSAGNPGFTVTVTRTVLLGGVQQNHESWTVRYKPQNAIVCGAPPAG